MKGLIARTAAALCGVGLLTAAGGCVSMSDRLRECYDPCWPERYNYMARKEVNDGIAPQVHNGHVLDQTIWNYHFEAGKDVLTPGGLDYLAYLARRRPCPDPCVYLQTAQDIPYDPAAPDKFVEARTDLDNRRIAAIQKYLSAQTAGRRLAFQVVVHDPAEVGVAAIPMGLSVQRMYSTSQGSLGAGAGAGAANVAGGAGASPR